MVELEKYAKKTMDNELLGKINIVKTFSTAVPGHVAKIRSKCVRDTDVAGISFVNHVNVFRRTLRQRRTSKAVLESLTDNDTRPFVLTLVLSMFGCLH